MKTNDSQPIFVLERIYEIMKEHGITDNRRVGLMVVKVNHDHIKQNWDRLKGKVILDCHNICPLAGVYHI